MTLSQAVVAATPDLNFQSIATSIATFVVVGFWHEMRAFREEIRLWRAKIDVTLFGPEGNNGLNGKTKELDARVREIETRE